MRDYDDKTQTYSCIAGRSYGDPPYSGLGNQGIHEMREELKEQIDKLHEDPLYMDLLEMMSNGEGREAYFAEMYIQQDSPFAEIEPEN